MTKIIFLILMLWSSAVFANTPPTMVQGMQDMPIMPGLRNLNDAADYRFSALEGRLVRTLLKGGASPQRILNYYDVVLARLGWTKVETQHYAREDESLKFIFWRKGGETYLELKIEPYQPKPLFPKLEGWLNQERDVE